MSQKLLKQLGATETESDIYCIVLKLYKKLERPLQNSDIAEAHGTHRTNIRNHMTNMIRKGLIKRDRHKFYIPVQN